MENKNNFPPGWDESRVKRVIEHYESQSEYEALAEDDSELLERNRDLKLQKVKYLTEKEVFDV